LHKDSVYQPPKIQPEAPKSLQIKFISAQVKREYEAWPEKETTLKDILGDIYLNPWGTSGKGKPEILRHKIMGVRGCISRRINGEDRLIYKATGPNEITIFAVGGHYNF
jgi:Txe/YoeB family toxin of Txe-Axe toxin-antitoxin module